MSAQPELVCTRCQPIEARAAELEQALRSMSDENTRLAEELTGARQTQRTLERQISKLRADLNKATESDPESKKIAGIQEYWKQKTGHPRAKVSLTGERAKLARGKLRTYKVEELMEAIDGAALLPYMRYGKRYAYGKDEERATQIEHCIGTDRRVDENRDVFRRAQKGAEHSPDRMLDAAVHHSSIADAYYGMVVMVAGRTEEQREATIKALQVADETFAEIDRMAA